MSSPGALRRIVITLAVYVVVVALLWRGIPSFQRLLLLPPLFGKVARGALLLGVPLAAVLAWRYPQLGDADGGTGGDAGGDEDGP